MLSIFLTDVSGALCIKHSESFPDLVVRVLLSHFSENNQEEISQTYEATTYT